MARAFFTLTPNELEIMELLWSEGRPLSRSEIIELSPDRSWKPSSIHILLNQLLDKGIIEVAGFIKTGKNYGRIFTSCIAEDEYQVMQFKSSRSYLHSKRQALSRFISALLSDEEIDEETLADLEAILKEKKR